MQRIIRGLVLILVMVGLATSLTHAQDNSVLETDVIQALNQVRTQAGKNDLVVDVRLMDAARAYAADWSRGSSPQSQLMGSYLDAADYYDYAHAQVLLSGGNLGSTELVNYWLGDFEIRDEIINGQYEEVGMGIANGAGDGLTYYVLVIAQPIACQADIQTNPDIQRTQAETVLAWVNNARRETGLETLTLNTQLNNAARVYAEDMQENGYPEEPHTGTDGSQPADRVTRSGYLWRVVAENILQRGDLDASGAFDQWWNSPDHRANILEPGVSEMGLWFACDTQSGEFYYVQVFAAPINILEAEEAIQQTFALISNARAEAGAPPVLLSLQLNNAAQQFSTARLQNLPMDLQTAVDASGYAYQDVVALQVRGIGAQPSDVLAQWRSGTQQYETLTDASVTDVGIGVANNEDGEVYYTVIFGEPAP